MFGLGSAIRDLSEAARRGELQPCVGREQECVQIVQGLSYMLRKNVLVVGGKGVGKTRFIQGIAVASLSDAVPSDAHAHQFLELNASILKGRTVRVQEGIVELIDSLCMNPRQVLVIDGIMPVVSAEPHQHDPAFLLGTAIKKGELRCIGTLHTHEFEDFAQANRNVSQVFKVVRVEPFSTEATQALLEQARSELEGEFRVRISNRAIQQSIALAMEYLPDIELPGKALMTLRRATEKCGKRLRACREDGRIEMDSSMRPLSDEVGSHDVKCALSECSSVDVFAAEARKWHRQVAARLKRRVFGQDIAVEQMVAALSEIRTRFAQAGCPAGVVLFGGPHGAGKSHMARNIAQTLTGDNVLKFDLPKYTGPSAVQRLFDRAMEGKGTVNGQRGPAALQFVLLRGMEDADPTVLGPLLRITTSGCIGGEKCVRSRLQKCFFIFTMNCDPSSLGSSCGPGWLTQMLASRIRKDLVEKIDAIVPFAPLDFAAQSAIMRSALAGLYAKCNEQRIRLGMSEEAFRVIAREGYTKELGAKGIVQVVHRRVVEPVTAILDSGQLRDGGLIDVLGQEGQISLRTKGYHDSLG